MTPHRNRGRIRALCALAAIVAGAGAAAAPAQAAPAPTNWTSASGNVATGDVQGVRVDLQPTTSSGRVWDTPVSRVDGSWPYFAGLAFAPSLAKSDVIQIGAPQGGAGYTIGFRDAAGNTVSVKDPVLHVASLGSTLNFTTGAPTRLTSENNFRVAGSQVIGDPSNTIQASGNSDSSGSVKFTGTTSRISFTATPNFGGQDGILVQLVTEPAAATAPNPPTTTTPQQGTGECTDWALYKRPDLRGKVSGNAQNWRDQARAAGYSVVKTPTEGAVMVMQGGVWGAGQTTGHVAYVESVQRDANGNPTTFVISEQNWNGVRTPTTRPLKISDLQPWSYGVDFILR
jgi:surface antigen